MNKSLPRYAHAATRYAMQVRFTSLLVLIGLFFGIVFMPALAHASDHSPDHAIEMLDVHEVSPEIEDVDHSKPANGDTDMPCHAVSHHHCSIALQLDAPRINVSGLTKAQLVAPSATTRMHSHSQAPPLDPPNA